VVIVPPRKSRLAIEYNCYSLSVSPLHPRAHQEVTWLSVAARRATQTVQAASAVGEIGVWISEIETREVVLQPVHATLNLYSERPPRELRARTSAFTESTAAGNFSKCFRRGRVQTIRAFGKRSVGLGAGAGAGTGAGAGGGAGAGAGAGVGAPLSLSMSLPLLS
jgi:hypothetical protein